VSNVSPRYNGSIFRRDYPMVIAAMRQNAIMLPVNLRYNASGYAPGTVLARNTTDGLYDPYTNGGASGTGTAVCILFEQHDTDDFSSTSTAASGSGNTLGVGIFGGGVMLYTAALTGLDSGAKTSLKTTDVTDATGVQMIKF
jgi:hypothetical protein